MTSIPSRGELPNAAAKWLQVIDEVSADIKPVDDALSEWTRFYLANFRSRFAFDLDYANEFFAPSSTLLDVGSSPPVLTGALRRCGFSVTGVDIAPERFATALEVLDVDVAKVNIETERWPFPDATFDGVVFNEIFEHLRINLIFTISELNRIVKDRGLVLLSTPNSHSAYGLFRYLIRKETMFLGGSIFGEYAKLARLGHMGHVREYGVSDVIQFFGTMGFSTELVIYRGGGRIGRAIPKSFQPFVTFVFRKVGPDQRVDVDSSKAAVSAPSVSAVKPWMWLYGFVVVAPILLLTWVADRFLLRWLLKRMGYPVIR